MNACEWSQKLRYGVWKCVVNQYHTKIQISAWLKCDIKLLQQLKKQFNYNYKMLQNNVIYEWIKAYKEPLCPKGFFLVIIEPFLA